MRSPPDAEAVIDQLRHAVEFATDPQNGPDPGDPAAWQEAQAALALPLAEAAAALGRLDATLATLDPAAAHGAVTRLALAETEAMLWAGGTVLPREEIGRDALDARAASDPEAMRLARWALRRLEGQGALTDLPAFLGLHRSAGTEPGAGGRLRGPDFAQGAADYRARIAAAAELHPLVRGCLAGLLWRQAGLSPPDRVIEPAVYAGRLMAQGCERLLFAPLGAAGRRVWTAGGAVEDRLAGHLAAISVGVRAGRDEIRRLETWAAGARRATGGIRGPNAGRVIAVLAARPLVSAEDVAAGAGISRMTAERMLNRMTAMGVIREITGASRFRLWRANPAAT
ncbi:hypothetical protein [Paracoccus tibetensis]|uniref:HTH DNA binding domain-containing protein n=1 Tax=Paracoccus tibetensis TaxID=336292 RepID=A0A1G5K169_9RHOB|nr:hypothetical protein [Paracoccus tibetensis]SCY94385.1 HTH DNA binding domain-containing protein [Paracoccus tibetensis]